MCILLDESLPIELKTEISGHGVRSVRDMGWSGLKNGELLRRAGGSFNVFLTADQNLEYQQNLKTLPTCRCYARSASNRIEQLRPLLPRLLAALLSLPHRGLFHVQA